MRKMLMVAAMTAVVGLVVTPQAAAITFGEPDGNGHPNVGAMLVTFGGDAVPFCSGSLIAPDVFLTAAHCIVGAEQIAEEEEVEPSYFVSFDSERASSPKAPSTSTSSTSPQGSRSFRASRSSMSGSAPAARPGPSMSP
jgi:hypothetical protein